MKTEYIPFLLSLPRCQSVTESSNVALSHAVDRAAMSPSNDSAACLAAAILADAVERSEPFLPVMAEYGSQVAKAFSAGPPVLKRSKQATICGKVRTVTLEYLPAGYVVAGSAARFQPRPLYAVRWHDGSATQGRQHRTLAEASIDFDSYKEATAQPAAPSPR